MFLFGGEAAKNRLTSLNWKDGSLSISSTSTC